MAGVTCDVMWKSRWRHCGLSEGLSEESVDVVKVARVFKARLAATADNMVKLSMDLGL